MSRAVGLHENASSRSGPDRWPGRNWRGLLGVVLVVLGYAGSAVATSPYPAAIGRVERSDGGHCTGTLIAPRQVLTAAHCVYTSEGRIPSGEIRFAAGRRYGQAVAVVGVTRVRVPDGHRYDPKPDLISQLSDDVALLELDSRVDAEVLSLARRADRGAFDSIGYAAPFTEEPRKQHACTRVAGGGQTGVWRTTCFAIAGASGAPLLSVAQPIRVVGMLVARHKRTGIALSSERIAELLGLHFGTPR